MMAGATSASSPSVLSSRLEGKRQLKVDPMTMETNLPRIYAAGDVAGYPGKITLITIGMGEAAIAANNAIAHIRGEKVQPKYSTD